MLNCPNNRSELLSDTGISSSRRKSFQPLDELPGQSTNGLKVDSDTSRILVVDDDPGILKLVSEMVARMGYHSTPAQDAENALLYLNKNHFDLVITDYDMPYMDGYQLADRIKERYFGTRVIIMTGRYEDDVAYMSDGAGVVDGVLLKPFNLETLKEKIEIVCRPLFGKWEFGAQQ